MAHAVVVTTPQVPPAQLAMGVTIQAITHALIPHVVVASPETTATPQLARKLAAPSAPAAETKKKKRVFTNYLLR